MTTGIASLTSAEKRVKVHPPNSGLLLVVNTAHDIKVIGKSWADELKKKWDNQYCVNIEGTLGSQQCNAKKWRGPCLMGGTKESATEALQ